MKIPLCPRAIREYKGGRPLAAHIAFLLLSLDSLAEANRQLADICDQFRRLVHLEPYAQ